MRSHLRGFVNTEDRYEAYAETVALASAGGKKKLARRK